MNALTPFFPIICALGSLAGTAIGVYVGMKVGLAKLETWREFATSDYNRMRRDVDVLQDDANTFDMEIGDILRRDGIERIRRQTVRP